MTAPHARRPRMLFLCQTLPYPPDGGVTIRTYNILRLLSQTFDITALCFFRKHDRPTPDAVEESVERLSRFARVEAFPIPQEHSRRRFLYDHARSVINRTAYTIYAYESSPLRERLKQVLAQDTFDLVHMDSLDLAGYLPDLGDIPVVCVHHNVESELIRRRANGTAGLKRWYLRYQADLLEQLERHWCGRLALNVAVSDIDARKLRSIAPEARFTVVPNGVDIAQHKPAAGAEDGIVFVGGANWFPNRDALDYFCDDILPAVRSALPHVKVQWVGRATSGLQQHVKARSDVHLTGYVEDVTPYVRDAACYVVPLRVGGGTRLKILHAWALGKAIVSTSVGCEGLRAEHGTNILVADTPAAFAAAVVDVLSQPELRARLEQNGRRTVEQFYAWEVIGRAMTAEYAGILESVLEPGMQQRVSQNV